ncbi:MAG: MoaD/ThiS family protein [Thermoprotei archaeon]|nr:MoaD/ThiS family protein [Thermoprotei archaeon]
MINNGRLKDYVAVLVNGITVFDLSHVVSDGDRIVVMPLASGG